MNFPPLPSPPTDNLYKFAALAGLILLFGSPVYWATYTNDARQREVAAWEALREKNATPFEYLAGPKSTPSDPAEAKAQEERLSKMRADVERKHKEFVAADTAYKAAERFLFAVKVFTIIGFFCGVLATVMGFRFWYVRVQKPQDLLLAQQVKHAELQQNPVLPPAALE